MEYTTTLIKDPGSGIFFKYLLTLLSLSDLAHNYLESLTAKTLGSVIIGTRKNLTN